MKPLGLFSGVALGLFCAAFLPACGTSDGDEPHDARGGSNAGGRTGGGSSGTAGSGGQPSSGGTSGSATGGVPSAGAAGSGAGVTGGGASGGGAGGRSQTGGASGAGAGGSSSGGGRGGSGAGGAPGGWTCENLGAEICFCRLGGEPLMGTSCTGSWNCCFATGTAERGNCQCFDTASDSECTDTIASVMGTRAEACPP